MTIIFFFSVLVLVSTISAIIAADIAAQPPLPQMLGAFSAGLVGLAVCFLLAVTLLFIVDPDPVTGLDAALPRLQRTLPITGLSAFLWLPLYLSLFGRLRRLRVAK